MTWQDKIETATREAIQEGQDSIAIKAEVDSAWAKITNETAAAIFGRPKGA